MRRMQDSVNAGALLAGQDLYAGYVDGRYANVTAIARRFPRKTVVRITVLGSTLDAHVADVETGDLTPQSGAKWAARKHNAGQHPTLYCNTSTRPAVEAACKRMGLLLGRDYSIWEAHYDGKAALPANTVAKQYADKGPHGENVDLSVVADYWPGVDPKPAARPAAKPAAPVYVYKRTLRHGMVGADVASLKRRLKYLGAGAGVFPGPVFGGGLDRAVRRFQKAHRLAVDGVVGPITAKAIG